MFEVKIRLDDQGQYSVGVDEPTDNQGMMGGQMGSAPAGGAMAGGKMDMMAESPESAEQYTPAKNLDDALAQARQLLTQNAGAGMTQARDEVAGQVWPGQ
jgi:hypothetical protein